MMPRAVEASCAVSVKHAGAPNKASSHHLAMSSRVSCGELQSAHQHKYANFCTPSTSVKQVVSRGEQKQARHAHAHTCGSGCLATTVSPCFSRLFHHVSHHCFTTFLTTVSHNHCHTGAPK
jgi:hypothetical protein